MLTNFPDVQDMLREVLSEYGTYGIQTDSHLNDKLPFITTTEVGGSDNRHTDTATVDVSVFTANYSGKSLAESIRQRLISGPIATGVGVIDRAVTYSRPVEIPWTDGSQVRRWVATYRVSARR